MPSVPLSGARVLVTGGRGYLGRHVARLAAARGRTWSRSAVRTPTSATVARPIGSWTPSGRGL